MNQLTRLAPKHQQNKKGLSASTNPTPGSLRPGKKLRVDTPEGAWRLRSKSEGFENLLNQSSLYLSENLCSHDGRHNLE